MGGVFGRRSLRDLSRWALIIASGLIGCASAGPGYPVSNVEEWPLARPGGGPDIPVTAYWPEAEGSFPVVLFSHGAGGSGRMSPEMMTQWAAAGYVVLLPTHRSDLTPRFGPGLFRGIKEFQLRSSEGGAMWAPRCEELSAVIDALESGEGFPEAIQRRADPDRVGLAGHSFGAYTALLVAGAMLFGVDGTYEYGDPRIDAVVIISGPGRDTHGLTTASLQSIKLPLLVFAGSDDPGAPSEGGPEWRAESYELARGPSYLAFVHGASHVSYVGGLTGAAGAEPNPLTKGTKGVKRFVFPGFEAAEARREAMYRFTAEAVLVFWDAYLKGSGDAMGRLASGGIDTEPEDLVTWWAKGPAGTR